MTGSVFATSSRPFAESGAESSMVLVNAGQVGAGAAETALRSNEIMPALARN